MPSVAHHIYFRKNKLLHPYQVRFMKGNKLIHSGVFATQLEAEAFRDGYIQAHLVNGLFYVENQKTADKTDEFFYRQSV